MSADVLQRWLERWEVTPDGESLSTPSSVLLPVLFRDMPAMLKVALIAEEARGGAEMAWWAGHGAARVLAADGEAIVMERARGGSLTQLSEAGRDEEATSIICRVAGKLHRPVASDAPDLVPLSNWFEPLLQASARGEQFALAASIAASLLAAELPEVSLHGDLHHHNVLEFGEGDWRAIDPKGLRGERTFDFVHLLRNPNQSIAGEKLETRAAQVSTEASVGRSALLAWLLAFSGLSAVWMIEEGQCPNADLALLRRTSDLLKSAGSFD